MVTNGSNEPVQERLRSEFQENPVVQAVWTAAEASPIPFEAAAEAAGLDLRACGHLQSGLPNRARVKIFSPKPGHTLVFFYKQSLVPYSRDRYSYGGIELKTPRADEGEIAEWLAFLVSGFHPDKRPQNLRRAFPYEIPE